MPEPMQESQFTELLGPRLGEHLERALTIFRSFGPALSLAVTNALLHATDKGRVPAVLDALDAHWESHLKFQHPEIRGQVSGMSGNPTDLCFLDIYTRILELQPNG